MRGWEAELATGRVFVPEGYGPVDGEIDLVFHLHGSPERVKQSFVESNPAAALVIVAFNGLSSVYSKPFGEDRELFGKILDEARARIAEHFGIASVEIGTLVVSSFSAGFGAVREIIPDYLDQINTTVMLDSIYAGYVEENGRNVVDPANMTAFELFANRAVRGSASMWITHSQEQPGTYSSTSETAEYLARKVGAKIEPADAECTTTGSILSLSKGADGAESFALLSKADLQGFHIRGYQGTGGPAHVAHLGALGVWLRKAGVAELGQ